MSTKHLAVIVSTDRLWPHDGVNSTGNPFSMFGLNLVTAMVGTTSIDVPKELPLLKPWLWGGLSGVAVWAKKGAGPAQRLTSAVTIVPYAGTSAEQAELAAQQPLLIKSLEARVTALRKTGPGLDPEAPFLWDPVNPKADEQNSAGLYRHILGSTSTMPAPVPYGLNLALCFQLDLAAVKAISTNFIDTTTGQLAVDQLIVAPSFILPTPLSGTATPSAGTAPELFPPTGNQLMWRWAYDVSDASAPAVYAYTISVNLAKPPVNATRSFFDLGRYWILNGDNPDHVFGDDWSTQLASRLADAWNLPRLLLDALPQVSSSISHPQAYWQAIVAALHDRANFGWIDTPDGTGLIRFALIRAADKVDPQKDDRRGRPASWAALKDGWARSLRAQLRKYDQQLDYTGWTNALCAVLPDLQGGFPDGPAGGSVSSAAFALLERVLASLGDSRVLGRLLVGDGSSVTSGQWGSAFQPDTRSLAAQQTGEDDFLESALAPDGTYADAGTLTLSDGAEWALTLGGIHFGSGSPWDGLTFSVALNDRPAGQTSAASARLTVTQAHDGAMPAHPILQFHLADAAGTSLGNFTSAPLPDTTHPYHLRLRIRRDTTTPTAVGKASAFALRLQVSTATPATAWVDVPGTPANLVFGTGMTAVSIQVRNDLAAQPALTYGPPSAVSARGGVVDQVFQDWDENASDGADKEVLLDKAFYAWKTFRRTITAELPVTDALSGLNLQRRLALGNISRVWPLIHTALPGSVDEPKALQDAVVTQLTALFSARFNLAADQDKSPYRDYQPGLKTGSTLDPPVVPLVQKAINEYAKGFAATKLVPPLAKDDASFSANSQALVLQLDRFRPFIDIDPASHDKPDDDLLRLVAGVGVLLRQALPNTPTPTFGPQWHALNSAGLSAFDSDDGSGNLTYNPVAAQVVAPVRVPYRDGAKQAIITYDNNPLNARSLLAGFAVLKGIREPVTPLDSAAPPFRYDAIADTASHPWALLPALKYGQVYQALPYLIGNCGALPKALVSDHPARLTSDNTLPHLPDSVLQDCLRTLSYWRRVGVGTPRLSSVDGTGKPPKLCPAYPAEVIPLSRELDLHAVTVNAPRSRFFYDFKARAGQLAPLAANWAVMLPRLIRPGVPLIQSGTTVAAQHTVAFGLEGQDPNGVAVSVRVRVQRQGATLTATAQVGPPGSETPGQPTTIPGLSTDNMPIDLRLTRNSAGLSLAWRVSDTNADVFADWTPDIPLSASSVSLPDSLGSAHVTVDLIPSVTTTVATFAAPRVQSDLAKKSDAAAPKNEAPLLLLGPQQPPVGHPELAASSLTKLPDFGLRLPATDLQTWDRWFAMDIWQASGQPATDMKKVRVDVWAGTYELAPTNPQDAKQDTSIDDPAVSGLVIELIPLLVELDPGLTQADVESALLPRPTTAISSAPALLSAVQMQPVPFRVNVLHSAEPLPGNRLDVSGPVKFVTLREGEIWELRVYPALLKSYFDASAAPGGQRFPSMFADDYPLFPPTAGTSRLFSPWRAVLEAITPTTILPDPGGSADSLASEALYDAVSLDFKDPSAAVTFTKTGAGAAYKTTPALAARRYRYVTRIDLARQVWRWRGRPVSPFPFEAAADAAQRDNFPDTNPSAWPMVWDAEGFGDRSAMDLLDSSTGLHVADPSATLFRDDLSNDSRALYYRVSARAISRYAPLYPLATIGAQMFHTRPGADPPEGTAWKRLFVPCRFSAPVPRPVVKLVVPLTQAEADGVRAPGLLAVLDEASFRRGGLAETVEAEVVRVVYTDPQSNKSVWPEFGPDPILRGQGFAVGMPPQPRTDPINLQLIGPVGHTFEPAVDAPRFVASTLVVQAPVVRPVDPDLTLAWYFARVRFRRLLLAEAMSSYYPLPAATTLPGDGTESITKQLNIHVSDTQDYALTLAEINVPASAEAGTLTVRLGDHWLIVTFTSDAKHFILSFDPASAPGPVPSPAFPATQIFGTSADVRPMTLDLRFLLQRDPPAAASSGGSVPIPNWHVSASFRVRSYVASSIPFDPANASIPPTLGMWQTLQAFNWPEADLPKDLGVRWSGAQPLTLRGPVQGAAFVSPFTEPVWAQLLPDSNILIPASVVANPTAAGVGWLNNGSAEPLLQLVKDSSGGAVQVDTDWNLADVTPGEGSQCHFTYQILLTEPIDDVYGRHGQERYLGLYGPVAPNVAQPLRALHISPILTAAGEAVHSVPSVRVRVIELQSTQGSDGVGTLPSEAAWQKLFGPPTASDPTQAVDAKARIVRVSQPVDLKRKVDIS